MRSLFVLLPVFQLFSVSPVIVKTECTIDKVEFYVSQKFTFSVTLFFSVTKKAFRCWEGLCDMFHLKKCLSYLNAFKLNIKPFQINIKFKGHLNGRLYQVKQLDL